MVYCSKEKRVVYKSKVYFVFVSIIALYGIMNLGYMSFNVASAQSTTTPTGTAAANNVEIQSTYFVIAPVQQHLGDNKNDIFAPGYPYRGDRKSTRLNSSHANISYAVFCLKKKNIQLCHLNSVLHT